MAWILLTFAVNDIYTDNYNNNIILPYDAI